MASMLGARSCSKPARSSLNRMPRASRRSAKHDSKEKSGFFRTTGTNWRVWRRATSICRTARNIDSVASLSSLTFNPRMLQVSWMSCNVGGGELGHRGKYWWDMYDVIAAVAFDDEKPRQVRVAVAVKVPCVPERCGRFAETAYAPSERGTSQAASPSGRTSACR
eukprot:4583124-Pleurochrysis_carterae.AAC.2